MGMWDWGLESELWREGWRVCVEGHRSWKNGSIAHDGCERRRDPIRWRVTFLASRAAQVQGLDAFFFAQVSQRRQEVTMEICGRPPRRQKGGLKL